MTGRTCDRRRLEPQAVRGPLRHAPALYALLALCAGAAAAQAPAPGDPGIRDPDRFDPKRPIAAEMAASVPDGFSVAAVGDMIITRPLSQYASRLPGFRAALGIVGGADVATGNLETTIFDPRTFTGGPYPWAGDWTVSSLPAVAADIKAMGFDIVGRANNHAQDFGIEGMYETGEWLDKAGLRHAGAGPTHRVARAPAYFESEDGRRIALVSVASSFRETTESLPDTSTSPGRPGISGLHVTETLRVPREALEHFAAIHCALYGTHCDDVPEEGDLFGMHYKAGDRYAYEYAMEPDDVAEVYAAVRSAQLNADFVILAIHAHQCSLACDSDRAPRGPGDFLKTLARGAIDSGADLFVATGNHNLGPIEVYASPERGYRPIFYGLGNFFWSDVVEQLPKRLFQENRETLEAAWQDPSKATAYDLTAPLNAGYFANDFTFRSVIADVRFSNNELEKIVLHPVEEGYGKILTESGIPQVVTDEAVARDIFRQITGQTASFGLPALDIRYTNGTAEITP